MWWTRRFHLRHEPKLTKEKGYECSVKRSLDAKRMMDTTYRVDGRKWMLHFNRSGEAMDWLIDRMTTASSVGGSDPPPVMEHWYEDPEEINGEFRYARIFGRPERQRSDDNPQQDVCDNMAAYCAKEGVDIRYQTERSAGEGRRQGRGRRGENRRRLHRFNAKKA